MPHQLHARDHAIVEREQRPRVVRLAAPVRRRARVHEPGAARRPLHQRDVRVPEHDRVEVLALERPTGTLGGRPARAQVPVR